MSTNVLFTANTNLLELNGLKNAATNSFINTATVVATLQDKDGADVVGETWPFALDYVVGSDGCYQAMLDAALQLNKDQYYTLTLAAQGEGLDALWEQQLIVKQRN